MTRPTSRVRAGVPGPHRLHHAADMECDVVVVGSGAGGATVALELARTGLDVVMLEEGPFVPYEEAPSSMPESFATLWRNGGMTAALGQPPIAMAMGRCVGGSTEINAAIMQRCPEPLLEDWCERYQIADFGPRQMHAHYEAAAAVVNPALTPAPHGRSGEALRQAAAALGWRSTELERAHRHCVGTNHCAAGCPTGAKQTMSTTAIRQALGHGLRLFAECRATRVRLKRGRVAGVDAVATDAAGRTRRVRLRARSVFCCAGAIHTPVLLQRSGVRRNVGRTLRLHPSLKLLARFSDPVDAAQSRLPLHAVTEFAPAQRFGGSLFAPGTFGMTLAEDPASRDGLAGSLRYCALYYGMIRAEGTGRIRCIPGAREPLVTYDLTERDLRELAVVHERLLSLSFETGAVELHGPLAGTPPVRSPRGLPKPLELAELRRRLQLFSIHIFSSCPPGEDRSKCATDSFGAVHDVDGLYVADASLIPEAPGVNPQLTVMAFAHRAASAFLASR